MKKILLSLFVLSSIVGMAQTDIYFKINHKLGSADFAYNQAAVTNIDHNISINRLEYYLAEIVIIHDGGTETSVSDTWLLIGANTPTNVLLGDYNITNIEGVRFGIGVESSVNHLDPSTYAAGHPLAPQLPSMHWGWSAGYRFVALEGKADPNLSQTFEIHALEDKNYHTIMIPTAGVMSGNDKVIELNADYLGALNDISLSGGVIQHGGDYEAADCLFNFAAYVFTSIEGNSPIGIEESDPTLALELYPNPSNGTIFIQTEGMLEVRYEMQIVDVLGREIESLECLGGEKVEIRNLSPGNYVLIATSEGISKSINFVVQ